MSLQRKVTVRGVIYADGQVFAQRLITERGINSFWSIPGGKLDPAESLTVGLEREMIEETGVKPDIGQLLFIQQFKNDTHDFIEFFYHIKNASDYESIDLASTTHGLEEVDECGFVDVKSVDIRPAGIAELDLEDLVSNSRPVVLLDNLNEVKY